MRPLTNGSERVAAALRFGVELDRAMRRNGVGRRPLADAAMVSPSAIGQYRRGRNLPTTTIASRIATALRAPGLLRIVEDARRAACLVCGQTVWQDFGFPQLYCSNPCRVIAGQLGYASRSRGSRIDREALQGALDAHRDAVSRMCGSCPNVEDNLCWLPDCALRPVSPVRSATGNKSAVRVERPDPYNDKASANRSAALRRAHADRPEWRIATAEHNRRRFAAMTTVQKDAWRKSISDGRRRRKQDAA